MNCPKCDKKILIKNGVINGLQRFKCKSCQYNFTVEKKSSSVDPIKKRTALILYLEGVKVTSIAQILDVSHVSILKWVKKYGNNLSELRAHSDGNMDDRTTELNIELQTLNLQRDQNDKEVI